MNLILMGLMILLVQTVSNVGVLTTLLISLLTPPLLVIVQMFVDARKKRHHHPERQDSIGGPLPFVAPQARLGPSSTTLACPSAPRLE